MSISELERNISECIQAFEYPSESDMFLDVYVYTLPGEYVFNTRGHHKHELILNELQ